MGAFLTSNQTDRVQISSAAQKMRYLILALGLVCKTNLISVQFRFSSLMVYGAAAGVAVRLSLGISDGFDLHIDR